MRITLNGEPHDLPAPLTIADLLARLGLDGRRVAVEHNLVVLKRAAFDQVVVKDGDEVEVVNFVGGGADRAGSGTRKVGYRWQTVSGLLPSADPW
jgi:sulfur carrier protein